MRPSNVKTKFGVNNQIDSQSSSNIFTTAVQLYGKNCFLHRKKINDVRLYLYRHIRLHQNYRCVVEKVAQQALEFVSNGKKKASNTVPQKWEVLFLGIHLCQKYNIQNQVLVKSLMKTIVSFKGSLSWDWRWFRILNPYAPVRVIERDTLYPFKPNGMDCLDDDWPTTKHLEALEYFLTLAKFRFKSIKTGSSSIVENPQLQDREDILMSNEADFVDCPLRMLTGISVPLTQACQACNPKLVLLLLRHGAIPLYKQDISYWKIPYAFTPEQPLDPILTVLNSCATWRGRTNTFPEIDNWLLMRLKEWESKQEKKALSCLRMFSRAMASLPVSIRPAGFLQLASLLDEKEHFFLHADYMEHLPETRTTSPAELQHLCRCRIRKRLKYLLKLPEGIQDLPLPTRVQQYLDLQID